MPVSSSIFSSRQKESHLLQILVLVLEAQQKVVCSAFYPRRATKGFRLYIMHDWFDEVQCPRASQNFTTSSNWSIFIIICTDT